MMGSKEKQSSRTIDCKRLISPAGNRPYVFSNFKFEWFGVEEQALGRSFRDLQSRRHFQPLLVRRLQVNLMTCEVGYVPPKSVAHEKEDVVSGHCSG